jgi:hypothetical protein
MPVQALDATSLTRVKNLMFNTQHAMRGGDRGMLLADLQTLDTKSNTDELKKYRDAERRLKEDVNLTAEQRERQSRELMESTRKNVIGNNLGENELATSALKRRAGHRHI